MYEPLLSARERRFVAEYVVDWDASAALIRAGYGSAHSAYQAAELLAKPAIAAAIEMRLSEANRKAAATREQIVDELAAIAFTRASDYVRIDGDGEPSVDLTLADERTMAAISSVKVKRSPLGDKTVEVKTHDKLKALVELATLLGVNLPTPAESPVADFDSPGLTAEDAARAYETLLNGGNGGLA